MRGLTDEDVATLARASGLQIGDEELHEVALRLNVMLDAIDRVADQPVHGLITDPLPDEW